MRSILFVCTGNTCRSVLAEYLARSRCDPREVKFASAGLRLVSSETAENAVSTLRALFEIDASAHVPRAIDCVHLEDFDLVVAIDGPGESKVASCLETRGVPTRALVRWKIPDPYGDQDDDAYCRSAQKIVRAVSELKRTHFLAPRAT